jgi:putative addiction module component (TIGR02574 family)
VHDHAELFSLPIEERLKLIDDLWDSIDAEQENRTLTPEEREVIERELAAYRADGDRGIPFEGFATHLRQS